MNNIRIQYLVPGTTLKNYEGQYITTAITGYGQIVAQVVKFDDTTKMVTLTVFTPRGVMPLQVHETDLYGIALYTGPIPPTFGQGMGQGGPQMGGPQMGGPQMGGPQMGGPQMGGPQMGGPQMGGPQMGGPQMGGPQMGGPQMGGPQMGPPQGVWIPFHWGGQVPGWLFGGPRSGWDHRRGY